MLNIQFLFNQLCFIWIMQISKSIFKLSTSGCLPWISPPYNPLRRSWTFSKTSTEFNMFMYPDGKNTASLLSSKEFIFVKTSWPFLNQFLAASLLLFKMINRCSSNYFQVCLRKILPLMFTRIVNWLLLFMIPNRENLAENKCWPLSKNKFKSLFMKIKMKTKLIVLKDPKINWSLTKESLSLGRILVGNHQGTQSTFGKRK